ncbi:MAG: sugar phosphate isomerase/epimerase [Anaerolineae bacterium]|nr:sugar phosphate isomerase/epimerase [Anaerolineae bacterium]
MQPTESGLVVNTGIDYDISVREILETFHEQGVNCASIGGQPSHVASWWSDDALSDLVELCDSLRMTIHSIHCPIGTDHNLCSVDPQILAKTVKGMERAIRAATELGAEAVVFHAYALQDPLFQRVRTIETHLEELILLAEALNVQFAVENLPNEGCVGALYAIMAVMGDRLKFCWDSGHANLPGSGGLSLLDCLRDSLCMVHLSDNDGQTDQHLIPGMGSMDFDKIMKKLAKIGYRGCILLETKRPRGMTLVRAVKLNLEAGRTLLSLREGYTMGLGQ